MTEVRRFTLRRQFPGVGGLLDVVKDVGSRFSPKYPNRTLSFSVSPCKHTPELGDGTDGAEGSGHRLRVKNFGSYK